MSDDLVYRLRKRAEIRRGNTQRKSVINNEPDRISDLLEEAATRIKELEEALKALRDDVLTTAEETGREVVERETFQQACDALAKLEGK